MITPSHVATHHVTWQGFRNNFPDSSLVSTAIAEKRSARLVGLPLRRRPRGGHDQSLDKWRMLCLWVNGKNTVEIGKELHRHSGAIHKAARRIGLIGDEASRNRGSLQACLYDFGERFDTAAARALRDACGLSARMFARLIGIPEWMIYNATNPADPPESMRRRSGQDHCLAR